MGQDTFPQKLQRPPSIEQVSFKLAVAGEDAGVTAVDTGRVTAFEDIGRRRQKTRHVFGSLTGKAGTPGGAIKQQYGEECLANRSKRSDRRPSELLRFDSQQSAQSFAKRNGERNGRRFIVEARQLQLEHIGRDVVTEHQVPANGEWLLDTAANTIGARYATQRTVIAHQRR